MPTSATSHNSLAVEISDLPRRQTQFVRKHFVCVLPKPGRRYRGLSVMAAEIEGRARGKVGAYTGLFHLPEHGIVLGAIDILFNHLSEGAIGAPANPVFVKYPLDFFGPMLTEPGLNNSRDLPSRGKTVSFKIQVEPQSC